MVKMNVCLMILLMVMSLALGFSSAVDFRWRKGGGFSGRFTRGAGGSSVVFPVHGNVYPLGYYNVTINIGQPPRPYYLDLDTGSDLTWLQCDAPCVRCLEAPHPLYQPSNDLIPCSDPLCKAMHMNGNHRYEAQEQCDYEVEYADGGSSLGVLVRDVFSLNYTEGLRLTPRLALGCGYDQIPGASSHHPLDGVLGLGRGKVSILSQLHSQGHVKNVIGHCLSSLGGGILFFGDDLYDSSRVSWTSMSRENSKHYSPAMGGELLFGGRTTGLKNLLTIFDSGSSYTYFNSKAYQAVTYLLKRELSGKPLKEARDDHTLHDSGRVPTSSIFPISILIEREMPDSTTEDSVAVPLLPSLRHATNSSSQVAIVGSNLCPVESLDYEIAENDFFKQDWRARSKTQIFQYVFMKWLLCFFIGIIVSLIGFTNNLAVENLAGVKFVVTSNMMLAGRYSMGFFVFTVTNLILTLFASVITAFVAPAAAGSGIPEVKAYLNGVDAPEIFSLRTLLVKIIGNISAVSGSLLIGKAGPMVHTGACVASILGQGGSKRYGLTWRWLRYFNNDRDRRDLVTCGSAAGIAASFRAPVGGVLFALEEMSSWWRSALLWRIFFSTAVVAIVLRALIDVCLSGKCGLFGKGGLIVFDVYSENASYHLGDVLPVLLLGFVGGILGSIYNFLLEKVLRAYNYIYEKGVAWKIILACAISIFTSCLLFGLPFLASCQPCPADALEECPTIGRSGNFKKYQCPPGHYNDLASLIFNTNDDAIKNLFSKNTDFEFHYLSVLVFFITCFFLSILSYGIVAPAGLFVPVIVTGASYGRFVGMLLGSKNLNDGLYAVLGAASFLGGSMRMTVSLCVILLELTNNLLLLPMMMVVLLISKTVADAFNANIYNLIMKIKGFPYLHSHVEPYMRQLTVGDVVTGPLQVFKGIEKIETIVHVLKTTNHNGFPVVDGPPLAPASVLCGLILRDHILTLLKKRVFLSSPVAFDSNTLAQFKADEFAKKGSGRGDRIEDVELSEEELNMYLDLHPFSNASPYTVLETMSLAKALVLFREVGLRHILVIPKLSNRPPLVGILTRHDFMPEHILGLRPSLSRSRWKRLRIRLPFLS